MPSLLLLLLGSQSFSVMVMTLHSRSGKYSQQPYIYIFAPVIGLWHKCKVLSWGERCLRAICAPQTQTVALAIRFLHFSHFSIDLAVVLASVI